MASTSNANVQCGRFACLSKNQIDDIVTNRDAKNTKKATASSMKIFRSYLEQRGVTTDTSELSATELDTHLGNFYLEARNEKGELYKKSSLAAIRSEINRYLSTLGNAKTMDIVHGEEFKASTKMFKAMGKELKRQGKGGIDHYPPVDEKDLQKLYSFLDVNSPIGLQEKVFTDMMLHFGRRERENLHSLKITDFGVTIDADGCLYVYKETDEQTKNHQDDTEGAMGRMYEVKGSDQCPVKSFMKYKRKMNPKSSTLFQRPSKRPSEKTWYDAAPLGHNTLGSMMTYLSEKAGLSRKYTNHSLRATTVHSLDAENVPSRHIMTVTGHKSESSLRTYTGFTTNTKKREMSSIISNRAGIRENPRPSSTFISPKDSEIADIIHEISSFEENDDFDNILSSLDVNQLQQSAIPSVPSSLNFTSSNMQSFPMPVIYNSTVTINYNFSK